MRRHKPRRGEVSRGTVRLGEVRGLYLRLPHKTQLHDGPIFFVLAFAAKRITSLYRKKISQLYLPQKITRLVCVANLPICGPPLILSTALKHPGPPDGRGYVAHPTMCCPLLMPIALCKSFRCLVMIWKGWLSFLALLCHPLAPSFKVHFRRPKRVFKPPPPRSKARMPPLSKGWKA